MKRGSNGIRWTVDWHGSGEPTVGHIVHRFTPTKQDAGFYRVTSVRQVTPRTRPLEPPYTGRYQCTAAYIGDKLMPWRMAQAAQLATFPWRVSALVWQEYWRTWHEVWRGPR